MCRLTGMALCLNSFKTTMANANQSYFEEGNLLSPLFSHGNPYHTTSSSLVDFSCRCTWSETYTRHETNVPLPDMLSIEDQRNCVDPNICDSVHSNNYVSHMSHLDYISPIYMIKPKQFNPVILQQSCPKARQKNVVSEVNNGKMKKGDPETLNRVCPSLQNYCKREFYLLSAHLFHADNKFCQQTYSHNSGKEESSRLKMENYQYLSAKRERSMKCYSCPVSEHFHETNQCYSNTKAAKHIGSKKLSVESIQPRLDTSKEKQPTGHKCPFCPVSCSNRGQLKGHIRIHTGEKPFHCSLMKCGKSFARKEELTRHKRIHTGVKPYGCDLCAKKFGRKDHLNKHRATHAKRSKGTRYGCTQCGLLSNHNKACTKHR